MGIFLGLFICCIPLFCANVAYKGSDTVARIYTYVSTGKIGGFAKKRQVQLITIVPGDADNR